MAFDPLASCTTETTFNLPVCMKSDPDTMLLHSAIAPVVAYLADHWIPKDAYDVPYVYRDYMSDWISANDVAALGRIVLQAVDRQIALPLILQPLYSAPGAQVQAEDVTYVAANANLIANSLPPLLDAIQTADVVAPAPPETPFPWWLLVGVGILGILGIAIAGNYNEGAKERRAA